MSAFVVEFVLTIPTFAAPRITVQCLLGISTHNALLAGVDSTDFHKTLNWSFKHNILNILDRKEMLIHYINMYFIIFL